MLSFCDAIVFQVIGGRTRKGSGHDTSASVGHHHGDDVDVLGVKAVKLPARSDPIHGMSRRLGKLLFRQPYEITLLYHVLLCRVDLAHAT